MDTINAVYYFMEVEVYRIGRIEHYKNNRFLMFYTYVYCSIWSVLYTIGSMIDIYIVYGRIKFLKPSFTLFKKVPVILLLKNLFEKNLLINFNIWLILIIQIWVVIILMVIASILINIPMNFARAVQEFSWKIDGNSSMVLYNYGLI